MKAIEGHANLLVQGVEIGVITNIKGQKMILTMETIEDTLKPVHKAIARTQDKDFISAGKGLTNFVDGAKFLSANLARELQLRINEQDESGRSAMQQAVLDAYQVALANFTDQIKRYLQKICDVAGSENPIIKERCDVAITTLNLMTAARNDASLFRRRDEHRPDGPG